MIDHTETRVKVVALYPNCPFSLGEILYGKVAEELIELYDHSHSEEHLVNNDRLCLAKSKFPANFKILRWWEDRKEEELPDFIKLSSYPKTRDLEKYPVVFEIAKNVNGTKSIFNPEGNSTEVVFIDGGKTKVDSAMYYYPATKEEFENQ
jgi:hypothetical protein